MHVCRAPSTHPPRPMAGARARTRTGGRRPSSPCASCPRLLNPRYAPRPPPRRDGFALSRSFGYPARTMCTPVGRRPVNGAIARFWTLSGWRQAPGRDGSIPTLGCHQLVADYVEVLDRTLDPIGDHHRPPLAPDLFVIDRLVELLVARDRQVVHQHVDDESPPRHTARTHTDTRPHPAHECLPVALLVADGGFALSSVS